jgi:hypothetical protein
MRSLITVLVVLFACDDWLNEKRPIDPKPVVSKTSATTPSTATTAFASFYLDTSGDQMQALGKEAGLGVAVWWGDHRMSQTFASCDYTGRGSALGGGTETHLEVAVCDDREFWLMTHHGRVIVEEVLTSTRVPIIGIALPPGIDRARAP